MASGIHAQAVAAEFLEHANEEQGHADQIAERITQLGGEPNFSPQGLRDPQPLRVRRGRRTLLDMIREDLVAERIAIESYSEMIRYLGDDDPTTRRMLEGILAMEEEHAEDMKTLLETIGHEEAGRDRPAKEEVGPAPTFATPGAGGRWPRRGAAASPAGPGRGSGWPCLG